MFIFFVKFFLVKLRIVYFLGDVIVKEGSLVKFVCNVIGDF